jgi:hypothetical protein
MSDNDHNGDDEGTLVTDGMVEYSHPSPEDSTLAYTFEESSTFNFTLTMAATKEGKTPEVHRSQLPGQGVAAGHKNHGSDEAPLLSSFYPTEHQGRKLDKDVAAALKSYLDESSMEFLPQRHVATTLLQNYFTVIHPIWPFLIEADTRAQFDKTWTSDEVPSAVWIAQLNLIFALSCQLYESNDGGPLTNLYDAGRQFYLRASGFVIANSHSLCSVPMLQTLLLAAQYQQGTMRSNECYLTIGTATRMALGLGLQTMAATNTSLSALDKELCRRLWWGCFSLDRCAHFPSTCVPL